MWIFALFLALPLIEIGLFVSLGGWLGLWPTLGWVIASGFLGVFVLQGRGAVLQAATRRGGNPVALIADGGLVVLAGVLLILPGFLTDALGLLLLVPLVRRLLIAVLAKRIHVAGVGPGFSRGSRDDIIDGEYEEIVEKRDALRPPSKWTED